MSEFITPLANTPCVFCEEYQKFVKFSEDILGFKDKRDSKNANK
jgi:hypothetical protein